MEKQELLSILVAKGYLTPAIEEEVRRSSEDVRGLSETLHLIFCLADHEDGGDCDWYFQPSAAQDIWAHYALDLSKKLGLCPEDLSLALNKALEVNNNNPNLIYAFMVLLSANITDLLSKPLPSSILLTVPSVPPDQLPPQIE